jgi:hypothetical protein
MADVTEVTVSATVELRKNTNQVVYVQRFQPNPDTYTQNSGQVIDVAISASVTLSLGGIAVGRTVMLQNTRAANYKFNGSATVVPMTAGGMLAMAACSITSITVINPSAADTTTIRYQVTD